jgi:hypothetical protein
MADRPDPLQTWLAAPLISSAGRGVQLKRRPPRPSKLGYGEGYNTRNKDKKYSYCEVGLLFEFPKPLVDTPRWSKK